MIFLADYEELAGQTLGSNTSEALNIVREIPSAVARNSLWFVNSNDSKHLNTFVKEQRDNKRSVYNNRRSVFTRTMFTIRQQREQDLFLQRKINLQTKPVNQQLTDYRNRSPLRNQSSSNEHLPRQQTCYADLSPQRERDTSLRHDRTRERSARRKIEGSRSPGRRKYINLIYYNYSFFYLVFN